MAKRRRKRAGYGLHSLNQTMSSYFLWPSSKGELFFSVNGCIERLEEKLYRLYKEEGYPVFVSSGRFALTLALRSVKATRATPIYVFPFASHCVLDAVTRIGRPTTDPMNCVKVIYHQWGYKSETSIDSGDIEDAVDSLVIPGSKLFISGGSFEIWSLPKILGTSGGGVLWCKDEQNYKKAIDMRNRSRNIELMQLLRRLGRDNPLFYKTWHAFEIEHGLCSRSLAAEVERRLDLIDQIIKDRLAKLRLFKKLKSVACEQFPGRLPVVVPINSTRSSQIVQEIKTLTGIELLHGCRRLCLGKDINNCQEVIPIPIHQDIKASEVNDIVRHLKKIEL